MPDQHPADRRYAWARTIATRTPIAPLHFIDTPPPDPDNPGPTVRIGGDGCYRVTASLDLPERLEGGEVVLTSGRRIPIRANTSRE